MLPARIIDCHVHVIDSDRFPFNEGVGYRPLPHERGTREELIHAFDTNGVACGLVVQPSGYGWDNAALLEAIAASRGRLKGIAVVDPAATPGELSALNTRGIVGLRFNLIDHDARALSDPMMRHLLAEARAMDWWVQVHAAGALLIEALALFQEVGVKTIVEHWGRPDVALGVEQPAFQALLRSGQTGRTIVKLSAPYRVSHGGPPYADLDPFAETLLAAFSPHQCVWGSDWPFINTQRRPDYATVKTAIGRWFSRQNLQQVMWATPARLFGFEE